MPSPRRDDPFLELDLRAAWEPQVKRRAAGKALRKKVPRESHGEWSPRKNRPDPVSAVLAGNRGRLAELVPIRMGRMATSPFAFLRGSAAVMAWDLSRSPVMGSPVVMNGDSHWANFGLFGTVQRDVVLDLNDFDEVSVGPWEWDLKRFVVSVNLVGREHHMTHQERHRLVSAAVAAYRGGISRLQVVPILDLWSLLTYAGRPGSTRRIGAVEDDSSQLAAAAAKARQRTNRALLDKIAERRRSAWVLRPNPPLLTPIPRATRRQVIDGLHAYTESLPRERRFMLRRYHVADVVHRVSGVGSVGNRTYLALLLGNGEEDPLFLQVKQARPPAAAPYLPPLPRDLTRHDGKRVVFGQRVQQASSDVMLGWTTVGGRSFYVRQLRNMTGSIPLAELTAPALLTHARACAEILARAHARTGDAAAIAGYCGKSTVLDNALADWAEVYGNQTEEDWAGFVKRMKKRV